jgi:hypothetical protein
MEIREGIERFEPRPQSCNFGTFGVAEFKMRLGNIGV